MTFLDYIKTHKIYISLCILFIILSGFALIHIPALNPQQVESQELFIFGVSLSNWGIWLTIDAAIIGSIWAVYQHSKNAAKEQQEKGAEISKMVSQDLLYKCTILGSVIKCSELDEYFHFDDLDSHTFSNFDKYELIDFLKNDDEKVLNVRKILNSDTIQQIYFRILEMHISLKKYNDIKTKTYTETDTKNLFKLDNSKMPFLFNELVYSVLNDLEYICMYISSQRTNDKYIYQSLHQFFIRTVKLLGPSICLLNKVYSDKYYTNIIFVYNRWIKMRDKDYKKEIKNKEKNIKHLNPKIKTI